MGRLSNETTETCIKKIMEKLQAINLKFIFCIEINQLMNIWLSLRQISNCWFKNEYYTEDGDCGLWIGEIDSEGKKNIQTRYWFENCEEYFRG